MSATTTLADTSETHVVVVDVCDDFICDVGARGSLLAKLS